MCTFWSYFIYRVVNNDYWRPVSPFASLQYATVINRNDNQRYPTGYTWIEKISDFIKLQYVKISIKTPFFCSLNAAHSKKRLIALVHNRLQQQCYLTFLISLFVTSRNLLFGVFLPMKNSRKYQESVTKRCTSLSKRSGMFRQNLLKVPVKYLNL